MESFFSILTRCIAVSLFMKDVSMEVVTHLVSGKHVHCISVICASGFQASFCKRNGEKDYCLMCPHGSNQDLTVDSRSLYTQEDIPKCSRGVIVCLQSETVPVVVKGNVVRCACDLTKGFVGDGTLCTKKESCPPGMELTERSERCEPCPEGWFKSSSGYEFCQQWYSCENNGRVTLKNGSATADAECGEHATISDSLSSTQSTVYAAVKYLHNTVQVESKGIIMVTPVFDSEDSQSYGVVLVVFFAIGLTLLLILGILNLIHNRRIVRKLRKGYQLRNVHVVEIGPKSGMQKSERGQRKENKGSEISMLNDDDDQPDTFYPPINTLPAEPTAPEMTMTSPLYPSIQRSVPLSNETNIHPYKGSLSRDHCKETTVLLHTDHFRLPP